MSFYILISAVTILLEWKHWLVVITDRTKSSEPILSSACLPTISTTRQIWGLIERMGIRWYHANVVDRTEVYWISKCNVIEPCDWRMEWNNIRAWCRVAMFLILKMLFLPRTEMMCQDLARPFIAADLMLMSTSDDLLSKKILFALRMDIDQQHIEQRECQKDVTNRMSYALKR